MAFMDRGNRSLVCMIGSAVLLPLCALWAQPRQMDLHLNDGTVRTVGTEQIDSVTFTESELLTHRSDGEIVTQPIASIDSISFPIAGGPAVTLLAPSAGESYNVGDTLTFRWLINQNVLSGGVYFMASTNEGMSWDFIVPQAIA
ncbi:MAG: hypothetical protein GF344_17865, partial [Chitinivibrionales bacterium]|nr:hypothetical protein [Chitinivibrionales bacterium]MBD3358532.1 hypothetical protein [Chitinivibrionales bacterium]